MLIDFDTALAEAQRIGARLVAIDGLPVAGKSTLAERFETKRGAEIIYLDDFVRPEAEWRGRTGPAFPFGYIRYDEFLAAVMALGRGEAARYRRYDWASGQLEPVERLVSPDGLVVIEGVSALHPGLAPLYDLRFWVESDAATTLSASLARGVGDWEREWRELFMPSAELYMQTEPRGRADFHIAGRGIAR